MQNSCNRKPLVYPSRVGEFQNASGHKIPNKSSTELARLLAKLKVSLFSNLSFHGKELAKSALESVSSLYNC